MEKKVAHLQMIQEIVNRMSVNSFLLKGWSVVLVSALFALAASDSKVLFVYLAAFPALVFWLLDGYFLRQERLFRKLYDRIRKADEGSVDFSMDTSVVTSEVQPWLRVAISITLVMFHGAVLASIGVVAYIVRGNM